MSDNRIHYLDGLRGILALIVFAHHYLYAFYPEVILGGPAAEFVKPGWDLWKIVALTPVNLLFNPTMAINFFFLLSGYVQSFHYLNSNNLQVVQVGLVKRYFRLAVPTTAILIIIFFFHKLHLFHKELLPANPVSQGWVQGQLPDNLNFFQMIKFGMYDCFAGNRSYYQILWTMAVELVNSWMVLMLLFATHNMKYKNVLLLLWLLVQIFLFKSTHSLSFTGGILLCSLHLHSNAFNRITSHPLVKYPALLLGLYMASPPIMEYQDSLQNSIYRPIVMFGLETYSCIIGNVFLFCFVLQAERLKTLCRKKIFQFYGDISFMTYLTHFFLLFSFSPKVYWSLRSSVDFYSNIVITFALTFGMITLVSFILYKLVDKPFLIYCNRQVKKLLQVT